MSTTKTKRKQTERELILQEVIAREVADFDRYVMEQAMEMSRPEPTAKTSKPKKSPK